jgi:hypothetical protein
MVQSKLQILKKKKIKNRSFRSDPNFVYNTWVNDERRKLLYFFITFDIDDS